VYRGIDYHLQNDGRLNHKVLEELKHCDKTHKGVIVSGYPNNLQQVEFVQKCQFLPDRYFRLPFDPERLRHTLKAKHAEEGVELIIKRHEMERGELEQGLGELLDVLPLDVEEASERLALALGMKVHKKSLPYDSPRVVLIHPPYLPPPAVAQLIQTFFLHGISVSGSLAKLIKKPKFKDFVEREIRWNGALSKEIELALIETECKSAAAKTKGYLLLTQIRSDWLAELGHAPPLPQGAVFVPALGVCVRFGAAGVREAVCRAQAGRP
jgi:hypothetical protein